MSATFQLASLQIVTDEGAETVSAFVSVEHPGLAVTEGISSMRGTYRVTHVASGRAVSTDGRREMWPSATAAARAVGVFGPLGDWTRTREAILDDAEFRQAVRDALVDSAAVAVEGLA